MDSRAQLHCELTGFLRQHCPVRDQRHLLLLAWMVAAPSATSGVLSGSDPLKLLMTPSFSREELNPVDPGLRQFS